jgi:CoA:oxalate CoA-transferase
MIMEVEHPVAGILGLAGIPIKMSLTPGAIEKPAPTLGQHTEQVLKRFLGLTRDQVGELRARKIV